MSKTLSASYDSSLLFMALESEISGRLPKEDIDSYLELFNESSEEVTLEAEQSAISVFNDNLHIVRTNLDSIKKYIGVKEFKEAQSCLKKAKDAVGKLANSSYMKAKVSGYNDAISACRHSVSFLNTTKDGTDKLYPNAIFVAGVPTTTKGMAKLTERAKKLLEDYKNAKDEKAKDKICQNIISATTAMWKLFTLILVEYKSYIHRYEKTVSKLKDEMMKESADGWDMDTHRMYIGNFIEKCTEDSFLDEDEAVELECVISTVLNEIESHMEVMTESDNSVAEDWIENATSSAFSKNERTTITNFIIFCESSLLGNYEDMFLLEGATADMTKEYRLSTKQYNAYCKNYRKALRDKRYADARVAVEDMRKMLKDSIKKVESIKSDSLTTSFLLALVCALTQILVSYSLLTTNKLLFVLNASTQCSILLESKTIKNIKEKLEGDGVKTDDLDLYKSSILETLEKLYVKTDLLDKNIDKKKERDEKREEKKNAKNVNESVEEDLTMKNVEKFKAVKSKLYTECAEGKITVADRERLIEAARNTYIMESTNTSDVSSAESKVVKESSDDTVDVSVDTIEEIIKLAKSKKEDGKLSEDVSKKLDELAKELQSVLDGEEDDEDDGKEEENTDETAEESCGDKEEAKTESVETPEPEDSRIVCNDNKQKFDIMKKALYEKCAAGEITEEQREQMIGSLRDKYLAE